jgi:endonuclease III
MADSDIAYDVHLRRVFLRSRIADYDDREHMVARARELNPARPGALDLGAWLVGREFCAPGVPDCYGCPLTDICPKDIAQAAHVRGA